MPRSEFDIQFVRARLGALSLGQRSRTLVDYWLSLWVGSSLPRRGQFDPSQVHDLLPGIVIGEVGGGVVICKLAGTSIVASLGFDPTGQDLLAITPTADRVTRRQRWEMIASGAVARIFQRLVPTSGDPHFVEGMMLPLLPDDSRKSRFVVFYVDRRISSFDSEGARLQNGRALPLEFQLIPLSPTASINDKFA